MADINNSINVDASNAINNINKLNKSVTQANAVLTNFKVTADGNIQTIFDKPVGGAKQLANETKKVATGTKEAANEAKNLSLSWETIARVIQTQVLIRGLNALRDAFFESAEAAAEFQLTIGRINAIADQSQTNFNDLESRVKALSIAIGRDLGEAGSAAFEALQNDLGTVDETFRLLENDAAQLAVVTGGTLGDAVNALSSVIKVYGEDSEDAAGAAGILFGTINAGRVTLDELESRLGTVIPLAGRLGISFEQAASAVASISLAGVDAATAQTQLRNVLNKLIRPTDQLKEAFVGLRVEGFQELLARNQGDFIKSLQDIAAEFGNNETAIANAFNTIRGNLGVFNLLTRDGQVANRTLQIVRESAADLGIEFERINELDARQAEKNAARLGVIFTEVGEDALKMRNAATSAFLTIIDDSASARTALAALAVGVTGAGAAFATLRTGILATQAAALGFAGPFGLVAAGLAAFTVGVGAGVFAVNQMEDAFTGLNEEQQFAVNSLGEVVKTVDELNAQKIEDLNDAFGNTNSVLNKVLDNSRATAQGIIDEFGETERFLQQFAQNAFGNFVDARSSLIDEIGNKLKNLDKSIADNMRDLSDAQSDLAEFDFKQSLKGLSDQEKAVRALERSYNATASALDLALNSGLSDESRESAEQAVKGAEAAAKFALSQAEAAGNTRQIASAEAQIRAAKNAQVKLLERQLELQQEIPRQALQEQLAQLQNVNEEQKDRIQEQIERYNDLTKAVADGVPKEVLQSQFDLIKQELADIAEDIPEFSESEIIKRFGLTNLAESVEERFLDSLNNLDVQWTRSIKNLQQELNGASFEAAVKLNARIDEAALNAGLQDAFTAAQQNTNATAGLEERKAVIKDLATTQVDAENAIESAGARFNQEIKEATELLKNASGPGFFRDQASNATAIAEPTITALENIGNKSAEELSQLRQNLQDARTTIAEASTGITGELLQGTQEDLLTAFDAAARAISNRLTELSTQPLLNEGSRADIQALKELVTEDQEVNFDVDSEPIREANRQLDQTEQSAREAAVSTGEIGTRASGAVGQVTSLNSTTNSLAGSADSAASAFRRMEQAARDAAQAARDAANAGASGFAYHGGMQYLAHGGSTRGQDTLPTMLSPGEFVVNERSTRNFLPELQAINAGNAPSNDRGSSGDTNISIGDINVNSSSEVPSDMGRDVARSIKRELRRGTFRL